MQAYDSDRIFSLLKPFGYSSTDQLETANLVILNTCHIREKAEQKIYSELGRLREYKNAQEAKGQDYVIAVGGCVAQAQGEEIFAQAPYVSIVFGPQNYHKLPEYLIHVLRKEKEEHTHVIGFKDDLDENDMCVESSMKDKKQPSKSTPKSTPKSTQRVVDVEFPVESKFDFIPAVCETKASAFLTIQEGCNKFCHFCVVPYTRGAEQ